MYRYINANIMPITEKEILLGEAETPVPEFPGVSLFCKCREAYYYVAQNAPVKEKRVLLPAYTCETCISPFRQAGWEFAFYPLDKHLRIKPAEFRSLLQQFRPGVVVAELLYGMDMNETDLSLLAEAKKAGCFIMEDQTHGVFSEENSDIFDAYTGSIRKWFFMPDGGYLRSEKLPPLPADTDEDLVARDHYLCSQQVFKYLIETGDRRLAKVYRQLEKDAKLGPIIVHRMSDFSKRIYTEVDKKSNSSQRLENARCLYENLSDCKNLTPVWSSLEDMTTAPLWVPFYAADRKRFQAECSRPNRIAVPGLWGVETPEVLVDADTEYIYAHTVCFPCAQYLSTQDMMQIVDAVKAWDKSYQA